MNARIFEFGPYRLDSSQRLLFRDGERLHLTPKLLEMLILLIERRGQTVPREELMSALWPNTVVEAGGLARNVSMLRKALGENYIETLPKYGYRFVGEIRELSPVEPAAAEPQVDPESEQNVQAKPVPPPRRRRLQTAFIALAIVLGAATAVAAFWHRTQRAPFAARPLTTNSSELPIVSAAISPDGRYLAYGERTHVYIRMLDGQDAHRLELPDDVFASRIDWLPDNTHLLISGTDPATQSQTVWLASILGGRARIVITDAENATASPDGKHIAFVRGASGLWLANLDGNEQRELLASVDRQRLGRPPQFTADGSAILYVRHHIGKFHHTLESCRIADGVAKVLLTTEADIHGFRLLDDSELLIAQATTPYAQSTQLVSMPFDMAEGIRGEPVTVLEWPQYLSYHMTSTRDGDRVAFVRDRIQADVYVADVQNDGAHLANARRFTQDEANDRLGTWLADSSAVLFHSDRGGNRVIFRQNIGSTLAETFVTEPGAHAVWPVAMPDRQTLIYVRPHDFDPSTPQDLMTRSLRDNQARRIDAVADTYRSVACPLRAGMCVIAEHDPQQRTFFDFDPQQGRGKRLFSIDWQPSGRFEWAVSPDGRQIAFIDVNSKDTIVVADREGASSERRRIRIEGQLPLRALAWNPSGAGWFACANDEEVGSIMHVRATDGHATVLHRQFNYLQSWALPSPDGKYLAFQENTSNGNAWILERH